MVKLKNSKQRDAILHALQCRCDHPTAEQLYFELKRDYPALSLATVYRNLNLLVEHETVLRIPGVDADRFDGNNSPHYHFSCRQCGAMIDIPIKYQESLNHLPNDFDGEVNSHTLMFYGICPDCKKSSVCD
ncbi:MAG: transcriptional repressor [Faecalibacterium sp.]|nr:transcriptional repressor [Ruminococcus sp.]MCM1391493.1 transcriptional repressor [Ruminococcus sp.]MCM1485857.1 transcriptional repressor [Faecalibacterium sp.]